MRQPRRRFRSISDCMSLTENSAEQRHLARRLRDTRQQGSENGFIGASDTKRHQPTVRQSPLLDRAFRMSSERYARRDRIQPISLIAASECTMTVRSRCIAAHR